MKYTEQDLDLLIDEKLDSCDSAYRNICSFIQTTAGRGRVRFRIKELILTGGVPDIDAAIGAVEDELMWGED